MADEATFNVANSTLTTNFDVSPYYDDYDPTKNFYRILYRPGFAVQARELTQMQTMLQQQVNRFGKHIFREGSIVLPGKFSIENSVDYVKVKDLNASNTEITIANFNNLVLTGATSGVKGYVIDTVDGTESASTTKTLMVRYTEGGTSNTSQRTFLASETLTSNSGTVVVQASSPTGKGSRFTISEGVVFAKDHFIYFPSQSIILSAYDDTPTCKVGFNISEDIIRYTQDSSLLDPALEASNYSAPGADRLKLTPTLQLYGINDVTSTTDFVELFKIEDGIITESFERTQYSVILDEMAKRTYDESGDYYVNGLNVRIREHLNTGNNGGLYSTPTGNTQLLAIGVEPGVGYVKGYEVGIIGNTRYVSTTKSTSYNNVNSQITAASMGNYVLVNDYVGNLNLDKGTLVNLGAAAQDAISNSKWSSGAVSGLTIGTARVQTIEYDSGNYGSATGNIRMYLFDVRVNTTNTFAQVRSIWRDDASTSNLRADLVLNSAGVAELKDTGATAALLFPVGSTGTRKVRNETGTGTDMSFTYKRSSTATLATAGTISISSPPSGETFVLSATNKYNTIIVVNADANTSTLAGIVSNSGNVLTGTGTTFTNLNTGDQIKFTNTAGPTGVYTIYSITNATSMQLSGTLSTTVTGNSITKFFSKGTLIDLNKIGSTGGATRTITSTASTISIDLKESLYASVPVNVSYISTRTSAYEATKSLLPSRYVQINTTTNSGTTSGPYSLGWADVYRVRSIRQKAGPFSATSDGTDVTTNFIIDNGQRDSYYEHATITPKSALSTNQNLLVEFDVFVPNFGASSPGAGYFSVDSYPVDDTTAPTPSTKIRTENIPLYTSSSTGYIYDLRDFLDFRPVKTNTAANVTSTTGISTDPSLSLEFSYDSDGMRMPQVGSQLTYDYSYYNARRDIIVIDKNGLITVVKGLENPSPVSPSIPENVMPLAGIYIAPYPSLAPNYAQSIGRKDLSDSIRMLSNRRFTMKDIGTLRDRVVNLEYYASLNLLEKSAIDMQILDTNNLNRFKNGIFADTFRDHSLGDIYNPDYKIVVDPEEKSIRPIFNTDSVRYNVVSNTNTQITGQLATLPYTEANLINQTGVTSTRNIEVSSYRFIGNLYMSPDQDVWVDTEQLEDNAVSLGPTGNNLAQGTNTTWNSWQKKVTGYKLYRKSDGKLLGTFDASQKDLAYNNAYYLSRNVTFNQNTLGLSGSKFETIVETIYDSTRTGSETFSGISETTTDLGNKVVDVGIIPYMRPQTIVLHAKGLKANTRLYTYFDGENMSSYVSPLSQMYYNVQAADEHLPITTGYQAEGSALSSNTTGEVIATLRLPTEKKFRTGTKEVVLTDSPTNSDSDASTKATAYFVSQGLVEYKQDTILTTRQVIQLEKEVTDTQTTTTQYVQALGPSCSAYTFLAKAPEGEEGLFVTSVDIYLAAKHPTLGIWVEIREMNKAGGITQNQVPFSEVWIPSSNLNVNATVPASGKNTITFPSPVFLYNNVEYAFVIHTVGLNPDTYLWISRLGETDLNTGVSVTARPLTGTFYTTNNNLNWDIVPDIDPLITIRRAAFNTSVTGTVVLGDRPVEKVVLTGMSSSDYKLGETFLGNDILTFTSITGTINTTVTLTGYQSNVSANVVQVNGVNYYIANTGFITGEFVNATNSMTGTQISSINAQVSTITTAGAILMKYNPTTGVADFVSSNGNFRVNDVVRGIRSRATANVSAILNYRYSVIDFEPSYLNFGPTSISFAMKTTSNSGSIDSSFTNIYDSENYYFTTERALLSRSNEVTGLSSARSSQAQISLSTASQFLSPVVDLSRTQAVIIDNQINSNTSGELAAVGGGGITNKYITKPITLAEGQDAEDILVVTTSYRPPDTDVKIYAKIIHREDSDTISQASWIELSRTSTSNVEYSSISERNDFIEYTYKFPTANMTGNNGEVQYYNSKGQRFTGYKKFQLKIGLTSNNNSALAPRVADLRAIALQI